jgi:Tol biopolymer transport system component/tRNA A-37 threonylcarbamoyl transferase component Bud32
MTVERLSAALSDRYRIERELGQGGMATVYLAHDVRHDRQVAIKVLHEDLGATLGPERFLAEIKTTAKLQHPHILPLLDSGEAGGLLFYVMPFVAGETLRARLTRDTQLSIDDAVRIAREVADALSVAHGHGIIHRDIKPENILIQNGHALVADFGIALAVQHAGAQRMTQTGLSLGTPQYMSPEQAMGEKTVDGRADIYALGVVTYEMLTGDPPFTGSSVQAVVAKVLSAEPERPTLTRKTIPPNVEAAVLTALAKLPADRFASASEFAAALANPAATGARTSGPVTTGADRRAWLLGVAVVAVAFAFGLMLGRRQQLPGGDAGALIHAAIPLGDSVVVRGISNQRVAISPTGRQIAFVGAVGGDVGLWVREMNEPAARPIADTQGAFAPFFSPDGKSIGFFTSVTGAPVMKVVAVGGGVARTVLADSIATYGGADWGDDGQIYFTNAERGLSRISPSGGAATIVSMPDTAHGMFEHDFPDVLPGSRHALIMLWKGSPGANRIAAIDLATGGLTDLAAGSFVRYAAGVVAIGMSDGKVMAATFDASQPRLTGTPMVILQDVQTEPTNGTAQFAVSENGVLVYERRAPGSDGLVWVERNGRQTLIDSTLKDVLPSVALSPDGMSIAVIRSGAGDQQVWIKQLATGTLSRLSFDVLNGDRPVWTPDGRSVAFLGTRDGRRTAWIRRADGSDQSRPAAIGNTRLDEIVVDPLNRYTLGRTEGFGPGTRRLLIARNGVDTIPRPLVESPFDHYAVTVSPNGRWIAYASVESGRSEVYVRPFPSVDSARFVISVGGGGEPVWRRDGKELFFRNAQGDMFAVGVTTDIRFTSDAPKLLFPSTGGLAPQDYFRGYDVHPDGKRFLMVKHGGTDARELQVIFNWRAEIEHLAMKKP